MSNMMKSDAQGHKIETSPRDLKYNRLVNSINAASYLRKDIVIINDIDISDAIIEADDCGNNTVKSFGDYSPDNPNIFKDLLLKSRKKVDVEKSLIDVYLTEKRESLQDKLKKATEFYKAGHFLKANELYENALDTIKYDSYPDEFMLSDCDILAIKFGLVLSKIGANDYSSLRTAEEILISLIDKHGDKFPSMYYYLAKVYYSQNKYNKAKIILEDGLKILNSLENLTVIKWPGTKDNMVEKTTKTILEQNMVSVLQTCQIFHQPDAKCYFSLCEENNSIYFKSPGFAGYVSLKCSNKCNFTYHRSCWKKKMKLDGVKKLNSLLDQTCATNDCSGVLIQIQIFDDSLQILTATSIKDQSKGSKNGCKVSSSKTEANEKKDKSLSKQDEEKKLDKGSHTVTEPIPDKQDLLRTKNVDSAKTDETTQLKKFTFNTDAKEYVPVNLKAESNNTEVCKQQKSPLNSNAKEYTPPGRVIKMLVENIITNYCEQTTQTTEKVINQAEYDLLKSDVTLLHTELFRTQENYNVLLSQIASGKFSKKTVDASTETESNDCQNCVHLKSNISRKDEAFADVIALNEQLEHQLQELKEELKKLKEARSLEMQVIAQNDQKYVESSKILMQKLHDVTMEKEKIEEEFNMYKHKKETEKDENPSLQKILLEQINYAKTFYMSYISMFVNKCKHMIWELEAIKSLTNANTLPSLTEIEENLCMWHQALDTAVKNHSFVMVFYESLLKKFSTNSSEALFASPIPNFTPEPPSVVLRHFKSIIVVNKRLEQDLNRHMANYYKLISMPCPSGFNYNMSPSPPPFSATPELRDIPERRPGLKAIESTEVRVLQPPPGLGGELVVLNQTETSDVKGSASSTENLEVSSEQEVTETSNPVVSVDKKSTKSTTSSAAAVVLKSPEVVTPELYLYKLKQKYPLTPSHILEDAVQTLRESRGGLTGLDAKTLGAELKIIIAQMMKMERQKPGYQKISGMGPWAPINNQTQWQNRGPRGNCSICFEKMSQVNSTQLRCQHIFHTMCIRTWLQTDGICPICRSFAMMDDEFPPLK